MPDAIASETAPPVLGTEWKVTFVTDSIHHQTVSGLLSGIDGLISMVVM